MKTFAFAKAGTVAEAVRAVAADPDAVFLGGGTNLVDHLKLGVARPGRVVDVTAATSGEIRENDDGSLYVGAGVRNSDLAADGVVRRRYPVLAEALLAGASAQLRNMATTGGNPLQRTRCLYFQDVTTPCNKRAPGTGCSAIGGATRQHAILGASPSCVATHPSDLAVAMVALDARVHVTGTAGEREIAFTDLHRLPGDHPERDTVLAHGELITGFTLPAVPWARRSAYRKVRDRASYAFALVSVAAGVSLVDGRIDDVRLALGGVAHKPWRATEAEAVLRGARPDEEAFAAAAAAELAGARALEGVDGGNAFKIPLVRRTLAAVLRELTAGEPNP
ncbi:xanthine dehydrogenase family protein subunit M [Amycolatopsis sp. NPDC004169]|uniref:FAD binding domain-containing protein n=1 Tax=Amycolatopsis sp. NPDC004169 TaxID=3154453 RepID=UPI0033B33145